MFQQATRTIKANNAKNDKEREWNGVAACSYKFHSCLKICM